MKRLTLALLLCLCGTWASAQDIANLRMSRVDLGLKGLVETVDEDNLVRKDYFRDDWPTRKWFRSDLRQFLKEENGHVFDFHYNGRLKAVTYTWQGKAGRKTTCSYDSKGHMTSFLGEGFKVESKRKGDRADASIFAEVRDYSVAKTNLNYANLAETKFKYTYPFAYTCRQQFGNDGLLVRSEYFNVDSTKAASFTYTYNYNGRLTREREAYYDADENETSVSVTDFTYDGNGRLVGKRVQNDAAAETYTMVNNEMGDCIEMTVERIYGTTVYTYDYEYDSVGNWTLKLCFKDGDFDNATLRTLTYYKPGRKDRNEAAEEEDEMASTKSGRKWWKFWSKKDKQAVADEAVEAEEAISDASQKAEAADETAVTAKRKWWKFWSKKDKVSEEEQAVTSQEKSVKADKSKKQRKEKAKASDDSKPAKSDKAKKPRLTKEQKAAEKEKAKAEKQLKKAEKEAQRAADKAAKKAEKERKQAEKAAKKAAKKEK